MTSLTSADLAGDHARLHGSPGLDVHPILNARRRIVMPDGSEDETDSRCFYVWHPRNTFLTLFLSQHYSPHTIWIPQYMRHPNGVRRVIGLTLVAAAPRVEAPYFSALIGASPVNATDEHVEFKTFRGEALELIAPSALPKRFGSEAPPPCRTFTDYGLSLRYEVERMSTCRELLIANAVPFTELQDMIRVGAPHAAGIVTEFVQSPGATE